MRQQIYIGEKYIIESEGELVYKRKREGNGPERMMKYYPERDIAAIAGEIDELTAWQLLRDVCSQLMEQSKKVSESDTSEGKCNAVISPAHILIGDEGQFILSEWSESKDMRYVAPEGYEPVWALGATMFYIVLGCDVFQGSGGRYQRATTPVPMLRKDLEELSKLVARCLAYNPADRPEIKEIMEISERNCVRLGKDVKALKLKNVGMSAMTSDEIEQFWPEKI